MERFPATSWDPDRPEMEAILARAVVTDSGLIGSASNYVFLLALQDAEAGAGYAIYKPSRGEQPLWDFPPALYRREVATYVLSRALGWPRVPPTIEREADLPHGVGSVQAYVPADRDCTYFDLRAAHAEHMQRIAVFDWLSNNADRKGGHVLRDAAARIWVIDHGLTFHVDEKLRTVIWDYAGEPVPPAALADVAGLLDALTPAGALWRDLAAYLADEELAMLRRRAEAIVRERRFPEPPSHRRPYPWPLI